MAQFTAREVSEVPDAQALWDSLVERSPYSWFWHTWHWHVYVLAAGQSFEAKDHSFFIYENEIPIGLCPLIIQRRERYGGLWVEAAYYGMLPWPLTVTEEMEDFAFAELERRARAAGAGCIGINFFAPIARADEQERVERATRVHHYIATQTLLHAVEVQGAVARTRERYRRYDRKFSPLFNFDILEGHTVDADAEEMYYRLHVLDSGKQVRSRESYARQADLARAGEAFFVRARDRETGNLAGMLLVSVYKHAAFDNSVAIDPAFAPKRVGHMLRLRALEELERRDVREFLMPLYPSPSSFTRIMSDKERSISDFKEGFSGGMSRAVWSMEKFLDATYLRRYLAERERSLKEFFGLP